MVNNMLTCDNVIHPCVNGIFFPCFIFYQFIQVIRYRTWENFGVGKNWQIWRIVVSSPIFYPPIISFRKYKIISVTEIQSALLLTIAKTLTQ